MNEIFRLCASAQSHAIRFLLLRNVHTENTISVIRKAVQVHSSFENTIDLVLPKKQAIATLRTQSTTQNT